jgi:predicted phage-related endonuclease
VIAAPIWEVHDVQQGTPEWRQARAGRLCASDAGAMLATIKSGEAAARRDLRVQLVVERLTGVPTEDGFVSADMKRGTELEAEAIGAYESLSGELVERVGFVTRPDLMVGYSPDGFLNAGRALVECKVPKSATHLRYLRSGAMPSEHIAQVTHALWLTGADYLDFFSYDPRFPEGLRVFCVRVERDETAIAEYETKARVFLEEIARECEAIRTIANPSAQLRAAIEAIA